MSAINRQIVDILTKLKNTMYMKKDFLRLDMIKVSKNYKI